MYPGARARVLTMSWPPVIIAPGHPMARSSSKSLTRDTKASNRSLSRHYSGDSHRLFSGGRSQLTAEQIIIIAKTYYSQVVNKVPGNPALRKYDVGLGRDLDISFSEYWEEVRAVARAWIRLGLEPRHTVSVLGHSDPRHHISNLATIMAGGFTGGMYLTNTAAACEYIARDSRANIIVVGDHKQLDKIVSIR